MLARLVRVLLALAVCSLLGTMLGRHYAGVLFADPGAEGWGWLAGVLLGVLYAGGVVSLSQGARGRGGRVVGDMLLFALCLLALTQLGTETIATPPAWFPHALAACYLLGLCACLAALAGGGRPEPPPAPSDRPVV